jgi:superfamily II DNA or RNA helicase
MLANQIYISKEGLPPVLKNKLIRLAAFQNPEFYKAQAMRFPTYDKPRIVHCCEDFPKHIGLPIGCLGDIFELLNSLGIKTEVIDERFAEVPINAKFIGELRLEQQVAADALLGHDTGVLAASTAFGKTVVAAYLIAKRSVNTLIMVHLKELLYQWIARLNTFLDVSVDDIGQFGGGKRKPTGIIDVATIQSLGRKGVVDDIVAKYGYLIVDECHHISARSFEIVARQCKAKYVTGLSATVTRKDGHHPIEDKITNLIVMKGGMGKKQRQAALNALESLPDDAEKAVLATGRYLGEGFDDERLDTLFLTLPISWRGTLNQYAGRLHRTHDSKKKVVIYDYLDFDLPVLVRMYDRRVKGYRSIGYVIEDDKS